MAINWGEPLVKGLKFGIHPRRWLPFFTVDLVFLAIFVAVIMNNLPVITTAIAMAAAAPASVASYLGMFAGFIVLGIIWALAKLWVTGAIIHQSFKEKDQLKKSFIVSRNLYIPLFIATLITVIVGIGENMVPYIGWLIGIIFSLIFFFVQPGVIIRKMGPVETIRDSWKIFRKNPLKVFVMWLLITIIVGIIILIFLMPAIAVILGGVLPLLGQGSEAAVAAALLTLLQKY